ALRMFGAQQVTYLVPNRFTFGYGLTPEIVELAAERKPDLLITVDNGISSIAGVRAAKQHGMQVIVTDHHLPGDELPEADAIVNPNQPGDSFPCKSLAGVGVALYVMFSLRAELRERDWFTQQGMVMPNLAVLLDLVALGTVADVVPLERNNRILVAQGLARIRQGKCCAGLVALLKIAGRNQKTCVASDFGFAVAPRLNAAGRLEDMSIGIECLLTDDPKQALALAQQLDALNHERRSIEQDMREQAFAALDSLQIDDAQQPVGVCLYDASWHQGVIGILASRVKERLHRPVIAFAPGDNGELKGSARSIPGLHIRDALDAVAAHNPGLITKFGGHAMAAGLSLPESEFGRFCRAFDAEVRQQLDEEDLKGIVHSDGELTSNDLNLAFAETLRNAGPWGQGFPEPTFDGEFELVSRRIVGERHLKLMLRKPGEQDCIDGIAFNITDIDWPVQVKRVQLVYRLDVNEFQGMRTAQL
ncbi:MAG: single-stranded-DNA-specific exonuclease RecJ, partial [Gammaproteobacteria bacterium]|nr:single-stranded-DNA-specific exonuclease RecJ [Gammaproteobacteria bacterium]